MRYQVTYKCLTDNKIFESQFELDAKPDRQRPSSDVIAFAMKDSISFCKSGLAGIKITSVIPLP